MKNRMFVIIASTGLLLILFLIVMIYTVLFDNPGIDYPINLGDFKSTGNTRINPQTLLSSLEQGHTNVFQLESELPEDPMFVMPVEWKQADYFKIAKVIHQVVWGESLNDWTLYRMNFRNACTNEPEGLESANLFYFQNMQINGESRYSVREILIEPEYGYIAWGGDTFYPRPFFGWKSIDLNEITITAEKVINIAESSGGVELRLSAKNECNVLISMYPEGYNRFDWKVYYSAGYDILPDPPTFWIPSK